MLKRARNRVVNSPVLSIKGRRQKSVQVNIRLTEAENDRVNTYAEAAGITPAKWIRQKVFTG
jgi:hypothetical protein